MKHNDCPSVRCSEDIWTDLPWAIGFSREHTYPTHLTVFPTHSNLIRVLIGCWSACIRTSYIKGWSSITRVVYKIIFSLTPTNGSGTQGWCPNITHHEQQTPLFTVQAVLTYNQLSSPLETCNMPQSFSLLPMCFVDRFIIIMDFFFMSINNA